MHWVIVRLDLENEIYKLKRRFLESLVGLFVESSGDWWEDLFVTIKTKIARVFHPLVCSIVQLGKLQYDIVLKTESTFPSSPPRLAHIGFGWNFNIFIQYGPQLFLFILGQKNFWLILVYVIRYANRSI